jgi:hypothetical protein
MLGLRFDQPCYVIVHVGKIRVRVIGFNSWDADMGIDLNQHILLRVYIQPLQSLCFVQCVI